MLHSNGTPLPSVASYMTRTTHPYRKFYGNLATSLESADIKKILTVRSRSLIGHSFWDRVLYIRLFISERFVKKKGFDSLYLRP